MSTVDVAAVERLLRVVRPDADRCDDCNRLRKHVAAALAPLLTQAQPDEAVRAAVLALCDKREAMHAGTPLRPYVFTSDLRAALSSPALTDLPRRAEGCPCGDEAEHGPHEADRLSEGGDQPDQPDRDDEDTFIQCPHEVIRATCGGGGCNCPCDPCAPSRKATP